MRVPLAPVFVGANLFLRWFGEFAVVVVAPGRKLAVSDSACDSATRLMQMRAVVEPAVLGHLADITKPAGQILLCQVVQRKLPHARRIDEGAAARQIVPAADRCGVRAGAARF